MKVTFLRVSASTRADTAYVLFVAMVTKAYFSSAILSTRMVVVMMTSS